MTTNTLRSGIVLDDYKRPLFRKALADAGFEIEREAPGPTRGVTTFTVLSNDLHALFGVLKAVNAAAIREKGGN